MLNPKITVLVLLGKFISWFSRTLNLGNGSTWPGHLALKFYPDIINYYASQVKNSVILVAGTNGKTTTSKMIRTVLEKNGYKVIHNESGANLINGIISSFLINSNNFGQITVDYALFEVDEATLPKIISNFQYQISDIKKLTILLLNLFRDQLDRYGEVDTIARKWKESVNKLTENNILILNADDPQIAEIGNQVKASVYYFGLSDKKYYSTSQNDSLDSSYCLNCGAKLKFKGVFYSHLGHWSCSSCGLKRPTPDISSWQSPLPGLYNLYNTLAAVLTLQKLKVKQIVLDGFEPAFGRQEEITINGKKVKIYLTKNPVSLTETIRTIADKNITVLLVLNDQIPDGRDVSWIWDAGIEELVSKSDNIICGGERLYDIAARVKYAGGKPIVFENLKIAIEEGLKLAKDTLYILPTYSAMLQTRKILSGKKIL